MPFVSSDLSTREQDAGAPELTVAQRALYQFGFTLDGGTGHYVITDGLTAGPKLYFHRDAITGRLVLGSSRVNEVRMVRLVDGVITV